MEKPFKETKCGSAVLTALQIKEIPIGNIADVIAERRLRAFSNGAKLITWIDVFWHNVGIIRAADTAMKVRSQADIPDAPWIRRAETYGDPWYDPTGECTDDDYEEDYEEEEA